MDTSSTLEAYLGAEVEVLEVDNHNESVSQLLGLNVNDEWRLGLSTTPAFEVETFDFNDPHQHQLGDYFLGDEQEVNTSPWLFLPNEAGSGPSASGRSSVETVMLLSQENSHGHAGALNFNADLQPLHRQGHVPIENKNGVSKKQQFKITWEDIKSKVITINEKTGASTIGHALFDGVIHSLKHSSRRGSEAGNKMSRTEAEKNRNKHPFETSVIEDDHRYAAVILRQRESSPSITDHQYNHISTIGSRNDDNCNDECYIKRRYKRERQLVRSLNALFTKKRHLEENTSAQLFLEVTYEKLVFNQENFASAEKKLSNRRKPRCRVETIPTIDARSCSASTTHTNLPWITRIAEQSPFGEPSGSGVQVQFKKQKPNAVATIIMSPQKTNVSVNTPTTPASPLSSPESQSHHQHQLFTTSELLTLDHPYVLSPSAPSLPTSKPPSPQPQREPIDPSSEDAHAPFHTVGTNTETICGICNNGTTPSPLLWLRCFNSLCHYTAHTTCVGFMATSSSQLTLLPPFMCPFHR